jgi:hypothetical protein
MEEKPAQITEKVVEPKYSESTPLKNTVNSPIAESSPTTEQPNIKTEETTESDDVGKLIPKEPYYMDPLFYEVANYFNVEQGDYSQAKTKLSEIVDYIITTKKSNAPEDVLTGLRELEDQVQPPQWGEKRYTNVYKYIRLANRRDSINKAMKAFEKGSFSG